MNSLFSSSLSLAPLAIASVPEPTRPELITWILCAAGVAVIFNQCFAAWKSMTSGLKELPPPSETYVTKDHCKKEHTVLDLQLSETRAKDEHLTNLITIRTEAVRQEMKSDIKGIHQRVDEILAAVSRVEGRIDPRFPPHL